MSACNNKAIVYMLEVLESAIKVSIIRRMQFGNDDAHGRRPGARQ